MSNRAPAWFLDRGKMLFRVKSAIETSKTWTVFCEGLIEAVTIRKKKAAGVLFYRKPHF